MFTLLINVEMIDKVLKSFKETYHLFSWSRGHQSPDARLNLAALVYVGQLDSNSMTNLPSYIIFTLVLKEI